MATGTSMEGGTYFPSRNEERTLALRDDINYDSPHNIIPLFTDATSLVCVSLAIAHALKSWKSKVFWRSTSV